MIAKKNVQIEGYYLVFNNSKTNAGGVACYMKNSAFFNTASNLHLIQVTLKVFS